LPSIPGVTTALVGMKRAEHVDENLRSARGAR
jgi:aryl-alcohol dehydrogenase-like predicted oxidoreductase